MIFNSATSKKLKEVLEGARNAKIKKDYFKNILLYGPPGSGKRMFAEQLALYTNMDFYEISWMALNKYKGAEVIDRFFKKDAIKSSHGAVIYIDNAQLLFSEASSSLASEMGTVVSSLIEHCQQPSTQYIVIFGIPEKPVINSYNSSVIDPYQIIGITRPGYDERLKLLRLYRDQYFDKLSVEVNTVLSDEGLQMLARDLDKATAAELVNFMKTVKNKSELPTSEGLKAVFDEELHNSKKLYEEFFAAV
jgi:ATPase family AAA domain-containing protein 3A/B